MSRFRDLVARMAVDPEFARYVRANPQDVARSYFLTPDEAEKLRGLTDAQTGTGPSALGARLSKSGITAGVVGASLATGEGGALVDSFKPLPIQLEPDLSEQEDPVRKWAQTMENMSNDALSQAAPGLGLPGDTPPDNPYDVLEAAKPHEPPAQDQPPVHLPDSPPSDPVTPADQSSAAETAPPANADPVPPANADLAPAADTDPPAPPDPFAAEAGDEAGDTAKPAQAGPSVAGPAVIVVPATDGLGADEIAIGVAGLVAGAAAGGVAGAVAAKKSHPKSA